MDDINSLYLCEKPSQGRDLAKVLGCRKSGDGYLTDDNGIYVSWAIGHLLEQKMPGDYNSEDKKWQLDRLPLVPDVWEMKVKPSTAKQYKVVKQLITHAKHILISTDAESEGEVIARELLEDANYSGTIERVWMQGLDDASIKRALANIRPDHASINLYYQGLARARADWIVGINASRAFTLLAQKAGSTETLHVGRVITPVVGLVCNRDKEISDFKPVPFFTLDIAVAIREDSFDAHWVPPDDISDEQGRCLDQAYAEEVSLKCDGASGLIKDVESKSSKQSSPLPFCLTSLQQYCSQRWGYTADEVLQSCQILYEQHKLISYPRTDSRYLPRSMFPEAQSVSRSIVQNLPSIAHAVTGADFQHQPRCYKDEKVTAHHAIVPTSHISASMENLKAKECNIYEAVSIFFLAQFHEQFEFEQTRVLIQSKGELFEAKGKVTLNPGWKQLFTSEEQYNPDDEKESKSNNEDSQLPPLAENDEVVIFSEDVEEKHTRPLPHYTDASLLSAMDNIHRFISEPKLKQIIKEGGIGTPATRASILSGAVDKGYLIRKKKYIHATPKAYSLLKLIPDVLSSPGYTAVWEQQFKKIVSGQLDFSTFVDQIENWIAKIVTQVKATSSSELATVSASLKEAGSVHECFDCGSPMKRLQNKQNKSHFWVCSDRENCNQTFPDKNGKPYKPQESPPCPDCGEKMFLRKGLKPGNKRKTQFWGCSAYPECRTTLPVKREIKEKA